MERAVFSPSIKVATEYRNRRAELIGEAVKDINSLRKGTPFEKKVETAEKLAIRVNQHPKLAKSDDELDLVLKTCRKKRNYSNLYWILPKPVKQVKVG